MNQKCVFQLSEQTRREDAAKAVRAVKTALKSRASSREVQAALEGFVAGELNEEEKLWAEQDPELAKLLAMCSQVELNRMREDRAYKAASSLT